MSEWSANNQDRARAVWDRLLGCFGEPLLKKFGAEPPEEWVLGMGSLDARQIARGMRRIVFGWKGPPPNLPDFMRLCRSIGDGDFDEGPKESAQTLSYDGSSIDKWETAANRHLLRYIVERIGKQRASFTPEQVAALVAAKKSWASDMRDIDSGDGVPLEAQKAIWKDYMGLGDGSTQGSA